MNDRQQPHPDAALASYSERCEFLIDFYADARGNQPADLTELTCRLRRRRWDDASDKLLGEILADPHGDMFWMIPTAMVLLEGESILPDERKKQIRELWCSYTPYRGDTENHWLMYYASLYMMAERYAGDGPSTWFNGRSSDENLTEAREYLEHWAQKTFDDGQSEFDSPHYLSFFIAPLAMLRGYARDVDVQRLAETMLTLLVADFAADQHGGLYAGAFSRIYPQPALERWRNGSTTYAWLLFGNVPLNPDPINRILPRIGYRPHGMATILALSGYMPPPIVTDIARDRSLPFVHFERHRTRKRLRYARPEQSICKTTYMTPDYAVGSVQGGILQPIQQHTWEVLWRTPNAFDGFNVLFTLHPYSNPAELGMYFPEEPLLATAQLANSEKPTYDRPDKWTGASPFERIYQHDNAVIALYDIPPGEQFPFISGYFSRRLELLSDQDSGWFVSHGDGVLIGYYPLAPFEWKDEPGGDRRLHSPYQKNGAIVIAASKEDFDTPGAFLAALRACKLETTRYPAPGVRFLTPAGDTLEAEFNRGFSINGVAVDFDGWPRYAGDFMRMTDDGNVRLHFPRRDAFVLERSTLALPELKPSPDASTQDVSASDVSNSDSI
jgi:hypothetical protein